MRNVRSVASISGSKRTSSYLIRDLENRLRPFLENRLKNKRYSTYSKSAPAINETDLFLLARWWSELNPEFKKLYIHATAFPDTASESYISPGGHFEVHYYTDEKNINAVDISDVYGYGANGDWRIKSDIPNDIPDYVDEVAWALDSAWSMTIDRFKFPEPIPFINDTVPSSLYKVAITAQGEGFYGATYFHPDTDTTAPKTIGHASHMEIRNKWPKGEWGDLGYDTVPENGIRVTCAHEFFHAIQYAMTWDVVKNINLDDYPITWIEGTAVLMEELAFDSINDYLQYADHYFSNPGIPFLGDGYDGTTEYTNSLLMKYLVEQIPGEPSIEFLYTIFDNNYNRKQAFHSNLQATSKHYNMDWIDILHSFHTESYFSGTRSIPGRFISDAPIFHQWNYFPSQFDSQYQATYHVDPYGMQIFSIRPLEDHNDTLKVSLSGEISKPAFPPQVPMWKYSGILHRQNGTDSMFSIPSMGNGTAELVVDRWKSYGDLVVLATNGTPNLQRQLTVQLNYCPITYFANEYKHFFVDAPDKNSSVSVDLHAKDDLRCPLLLSSVSSDSLPHLPSSAEVIGEPFSVIFPHSWKENVSLKLTYSIFHEHIAFLEQNQIPVDSLFLYRWDDISRVWQKMESEITQTNNRTHFENQFSVSGIYALFAPTIDSIYSGKVTLYPNPLRLRSDRFLYIVGDSIKEVQIYAIDGTLVSNSEDRRSAFSPIQKNGTEFVWEIGKTARNRLVPGLYYAVITPDGAAPKKKIRRKVLFLP